MSLMSSMSSMSVPRRSARIAARNAAKAVKNAPVAPEKSDVQKINEMMIRCTSAVGRVATIKANTEMFVLLQTERLWERNELFRQAVEKKISEYLEIEIPSTLRFAFQTKYRLLEWAVYDLQDALENLKEMITDFHAQVERIHKEGQERETLRWRWNTSMRDAVQNVRDKLNALFEPRSKGWWIAFDAHPAVQEWRRVGAELKEDSTIWW